MRVIIVGCGNIGRTVAESLLKEKHDVVVIDADASVIAEMNDNYDVMCICGNGSSYDVLTSANVSDCDLFVAVTESDEINMLSCFLAKRLGAKHTIARIREADYTGDGLKYIQHELGLSMSINPERLTAESISDKLKLPTSVVTESFAGKKVRLIEFEIKIGSNFADVKLTDLRKNISVPFIVCTVLRGKEVFIPNGDTVLEVGDTIGIVLAQSDVNKFVKLIGIDQRQAKDVMIIGGSVTAYYLAKILGESNTGVTVIEQNFDRCKQLSELLEDATVICGDGTNRQLLAEEGLGQTGGFVTLTNVEEQNLILSFYAQNEKVPKVVTKINNNELVDVAQKLGLSSVVTPKRIVADVITSYARALQNTFGTGKLETLYSILKGKAEALEFKVAIDFPLANVPLRELKVKRGSIVACITRGNETMVATGDNVILPGDNVVVISLKQRYGDLSEIVSKK